MFKPLFEVKDIDHRFYEERLRNFLPPKIIDIHTHVWKEKFLGWPGEFKDKIVTWPMVVADKNPFEDLFETYNLMFPDKQVIPCVFSLIGGLNSCYDDLNEYVSSGVRVHQLPALIFSIPEWDEKEFEQRVIKGGFIGAKSYFVVVNPCISVKEITIFDFFPRHQLAIMDKHKWIMMLHVPRDLRLRDSVNLEQLLIIEREYPGIQVIVAHVGRAYCNEDVGNAFEILKETKHIMFDISANTNEWVFSQLINSIGPNRILFGSDLPVLRMRMRRICESGIYVNLVPRGMYGDVFGDVHMREVDKEEADQLTFFLYEELDAFRRASMREELTSNEISDVFYNNAVRMFITAGFQYKEVL